MALPGSNALQHSAAGSIEDGIHELSWPPEHGKGRVGSA